MVIIVFVYNYIFIIINKLFFDPKGFTSGQKEPNYRETGENELWTVLSGMNTGNVLQLGTNRKMAPFLLQIMISRTQSMKAHGLS